MNRKEQIAILQSIAAGKISIQKAVAAIYINDNSCFMPLVGLCLHEHESGHKQKDIIVVDGIAGKMELKSIMPEEEQYL